MSATVVPRSTFLAVVKAKTSIALGAQLEAAEAQYLMDALGLLLAMTKARANHIGLVNALITEMVEDGSMDALPEARRNALIHLLSGGIPLAIEDSGFSSLW